MRTACLSGPASPPTRPNAAAWPTSERRVGRGDRYPRGRVGRADRDVARVAAEAALELRVADGDEAAGRRHLVEVRHALGLSIAVVHQPVLALERRGGVGVERLVAVEKDVALLVQELQRVESDAREGCPRGEVLVRPALRPVGAHEDHRSLGDDAVLLLESLDVGDLQGVAEVLRHLLLHRDHHQRAQRVGGRQLVDARILGRPVRRRIELGAELVGRQHVGRRLEAVLLVGERVALGRVACELLPGLRWREGRVAEARPDGDLGRDDVGEVDVFCPLEHLVVHSPEPGRLRQGRPPEARQHQS